MNGWETIQEGFYLKTNFFSLNQSREYLNAILQDGQDALQGFHWAQLKANRFNLTPKYPVKKYMCYGRYWDPRDYSYKEELPNGQKPLKIPLWVERLANELVGELFPETSSYRAESVLVNYYQSGDKMGKHQDRDEKNNKAPIIGISFGGSVRFYYGEDKSLLIPGNSVYLFGGKSRMMSHGLGTIYKDSLEMSSAGLLHDKERLSLTIRQVYW